MPITIITKPATCRLNTDVFAVTAKVRMAPTAIQNRQMPLFMVSPFLEKCAGHTRAFMVGRR